MALRYARDNSRPKIVPVLTAQAIAVCDLVGLSSGTAIRAQDVAWQTAIGTPASPTLADGAVSVGGPLTNGVTGVKISYQFPWGEGTTSAPATVTPTAHAFIVISGASLVPPAPALWTNIYTETAAGSGVYKLRATTLGQTMLIDSYGAGQVPYAGNSSAAAQDGSALVYTQWLFAQAFEGVSGQTKQANVARVLANSADNLIRIDTGGIFYADAASAAYNPGDLLGVAKDTGNTLSTTNALAAVNHESLSVARCAYGTNGVSVTNILVEILSLKNPAARRA